MELYLAFVAATAILILTPGPMVALIVANSLTYGLRFELATAAGSTLAMAGQLALVAAGLSSALGALGAAIFWIKWIGAAYLLYLGVAALRRPVAALDLDTPSRRKSMAAIFGQAMIVSATNPKTLIFYAAFFPLFVDAAAPVGPQMAVLAATFLVIAAALDSCWALAAARLKPVAARAGRWVNRLTGGVLIAAAAGLALARKS